MEDRFIQQLKKGVLEMMVLELLCRKPSYGYELLIRLKEDAGSLFSLKEGTLYPILYRLEDEGYIASSWFPGEGRSTPKKIYSPTPAGLEKQKQYLQQWKQFSKTVHKFMQKEETCEN